MINSIPLVSVCLTSDTQTSSLWQTLLNLTLTHCNEGFQMLSPRCLWNLYNASETSLFVCVCLGSNAWLGWRNLRSALRSSCCRPTIRRNGPGLPSLWTLRSELINGLHSRPSSMSHTHQQCDSGQITACLPRALPVQSSGWERSDLCDVQLPACPDMRYTRVLAGL